MRGTHRRAAAWQPRCSRPARDRAAAQDAPPADDRFEVTLLDKNITQGIRIATAPDGRVLLAERDGRLKIFKPDTGTTVVAGQIPTGAAGRARLRGPGGWRRTSPRRSNIYAHYVPTDAALHDDADLARLALHAHRRHAGPERPRRRSTTSSTRPTRAAATARGDLEFAPNGDLYIATGDNTGCCASFGYPPMDERRRARSPTTPRRPRPTRTTRWARSCASTRSPTPGRDGRRRAARTRSRPATCSRGTEDGGGKTLREIYAMGLRNPFTIGAGARPTASCGSPTTARTRRSPTPRAARPATCRMILHEASPPTIGWPYCYVPEQALRATGTTSPAPRRGYYDCDNLVNNSPNNLTPPAEHVRQRRPARHPGRHAAHDVVDLQRRARPRRRSRTSSAAARWPARATQYDASNPSTSKFPEWFNDRYFYFEWTTDWVADRRPSTPTARSRTAGSSCRSTRSSSRWTCSSAPTARSTCSPTATAGGPTTTTPACTASSYAAGNRKPTIKASADKDSGGTPLTVNFDATRLDRPRRATR